MFSSAFTITYTNVYIFTTFFPLYFSRKRSMTSTFSQWAHFLNISFQELLASGKSEGFGPTLYCKQQNDSRLQSFRSCSKPLQDAVSFIVFWWFFRKFEFFSKIMKERRELLTSSALWPPPLTEVSGILQRGSVPISYTRLTCQLSQRAEVVVSRASLRVGPTLGPHRRQ